MPLPSQRKYDLKHIKRLDQYSKKVRTAYIEAIKQVSKLTINLSLNKNSEFYFRNHPEVNRKVNDVLKTLYSDVYGSTVSGINSEWELAVNKNNELARYVFGKDLINIPDQYRDKYFSNNAAARKAFTYRKDAGLNLSQKVWRNVWQVKVEMELALQLGIGKGKSAQSLARDMTQYLNEPNKLFRRVRDTENGQLRLSKAAKAYNPGQGRYRSSYKNALRLTRNETNFSYENSQQEKRKEQDFIVGIKIKVSPQHNPSDDKGGICCVCLQGLYPKDFDWTYKWHVNCICLSLNILKTREELDQDVDKILSGKEPNTKSKNQVNSNPNEYVSYLKDNKKKWSKWKNPPRTFENNK